MSFTQTFLNVRFDLRDQYVAMDFLVVCSTVRTMPIEGQDLKFTCSPTEMKDHPVSLGD
jgi:hypothetical protein